MILYKLTDENNHTAFGTEWGENVTHCHKRDCTAHQNLDLALLLIPIHHARFLNIKIWEAQGDVVNRHWDQVDCHCLTTTKEVPIPDWYKDEERRRRVQIIFAILCTEAVLPTKRSRQAIQAAKEALRCGNSHPDTAYYAACAARAASDVFELRNDSMAALVNADAVAAYTSCIGNPVDAKTCGEDAKIAKEIDNTPIDFADLAIKAIIFSTLRNPDMYEKKEKGKMT